MNRKSNRSGFKCVCARTKNSSLSRRIRGNSKHVIKCKLMRTEKPKPAPGKPANGRHFSRIIFFALQIFFSSFHSIPFIHSLIRFSFCEHFNLSTASPSIARGSIEPHKRMVTHSQCVMCMCE